MDIRLDNKTAVVTGAAKGIGRGIALEMARNGARVVLLDINEQYGKETESMLTQQGLNGVFYRTDITDSQRYDDVVDFVRAQYGEIDILVNNAGITPEQDFMHTPMDEVRRVFESNFFGAYALTQRIAQEMIQHHVEGSLLFTTSTHQSVTMLRPAYSTSKAALAMLVRELALELTPDYGIRVNAVAPGIVAIHGEDDLRDDMVPMGNKAVPEDVGKAMVFLASDAASHITGHTLVVDGGFSHMHAHYWMKKGN